MRRPRLDIPPHPDARETWFRELSPERRAAMKLEWAERLQRDEVLRDDTRRKHLRDGPAIGFAFALGDLLCAFGSLRTAFAAALIGVLAGVLFSSLRWGPSRSAVGAMAVFGLSLYLTRGVLHVIFAFAWVCVGLLTAVFVTTRE